MKDEDKRDNLILDRLHKHLWAVQNEVRNDWFVIVLQGSQNYGLADENSDIDSKLLTLPTLKEMILNSAPVNYTHIMSDNDERVDVKDIREYFKIIRKQNINFMEILFSEYYIVNPKYLAEWDWLKFNSEKIARSNCYRFLKCAKGMIFEKAHALEHPYPSKKDLIEQYGFDGKQLAHAERVLQFAIDFIKYDKPYSECLKIKDEAVRQEQILMKRNMLPGLTLDAARERMQIAVDKITLFENEYNMIYKDTLNPRVDEILNDVLARVITKSIKEQI